MSRRTAAAAAGPAAGTSHNPFASGSDGEIDAAVAAAIAGGRVTPMSRASARAHALSPEHEDAPPATLDLDRRPTATVPVSNDGAAEAGLLAAIGAVVTAAASPPPVTVASRRAGATTTASGGGSGTRSPVHRARPAHFFSGDGAAEPAEAVQPGARSDGNPFASPSDREGGADATPSRAPPADLRVGSAPVSLPMPVPPLARPGTGLGSEGAALSPGIASARSTSGAQSGRGSGAEGGSGAGGGGGSSLGSGGSTTATLPAAAAAAATPPSSMSAQALAAQLREANQQRLLLQSQYNALRGEVERLRGEVVAVQAINRELRASHDAGRADAAAETAALRAQLSQALAAARKGDEDRTAHALVLVELRSQLSVASAARETAEAGRLSAEVAARAATDRAAAVEAEGTSMAARLRELSDQNTAYARSMIELRSRLAESSARIDALNLQAETREGDSSSQATAWATKSAALDAQIASLRSRAARAEEAAASLTLEWERKMTAECDAVRAEVTATWEGRLAATRAVAEEQAARARTEAGAAMEAAVADERARAQSLAQALAAAEASATAATARARSAEQDRSAAHTSATTQLATLQRQLSAALADATAAGDRAAAAGRAAEAARAEAAAKDALLTATRSALVKLRGEAATTESAALAQERENVKLQTVIATLEALVTEERARRASAETDARNALARAKRLSEGLNIIPLPAYTAAKRATWAQQRAAAAPSTLRRGSGASSVARALRGEPPAPRAAPSPSRIVPAIVMASSRRVGSGSESAGDGGGAASPIGAAGAELARSAPLSSRYVARAFNLELARHSARPLTPTWSSSLRSSGSPDAWLSKVRQMETTMMRPDDDTSGDGRGGAASGDAGVGSSDADATHPLMSPLRGQALLQRATMLRRDVRARSADATVRRRAQSGFGAAAESGGAAHHGGDAATWASGGLASDSALLFDVGHGGGGDAGSGGGMAEPMAHGSAAGVAGATFGGSRDGAAFSQPLPASSSLLLSEAEALALASGGVGGADARAMRSPTIRLHGLASSARAPSAGEVAMGTPPPGRSPPLATLAAWPAASPQQLQREVHQLREQAEVLRRSARASFTAVAALRAEKADREAQLQAAVARNGALEAELLRLRQWAGAAATAHEQASHAATTMAAAAVTMWRRLLALTRSLAVRLSQLGEEAEVDPAVLALPAIFVDRHDAGGAGSGGAGIAPLPPPPGRAGSTHGRSPDATAAAGALRHSHTSSAYESGRLNGAGSHAAPPRRATPRSGDSRRSSHVAHPPPPPPPPPDDAAGAPPSLVDAALAQLAQVGGAARGEAGEAVYAAATATDAPAAAVASPFSARGRGSSSGSSLPPAPVQVPDSTATAAPTPAAVDATGAAAVPGSPVRLSPSPGFGSGSSEDEGLLSADAQAQLLHSTRTEVAAMRASLQRAMSGDDMMAATQPALLGSAPAPLPAATAGGDDDEHADVAALLATLATPRAGDTAWRGVGGGSTNPFASPMAGAGNGPPVGAAAAATDAFPFGSEATGPASGSGSGDGDGARRQALAEAADAYGY